MYDCLRFGTREVELTPHYLEQVEPSYDNERHEHTNGNQDPNTRDKTRPLHGYCPESESGRGVVAYTVEISVGFTNPSSAARLGDTSLV